MLIRTIASHTDHDFYGKPVEVTRAELYCGPEMTLGQIEAAKRHQEKRLQSHEKRMLHWVHIARAAHQSPRAGKDSK